MLTSPLSPSKYTRDISAAFSIFDTSNVVELSDGSSNVSSAAKARKGVDGDIVGEPLRTNRCTGVLATCCSVIPPPFEMYPPCGSLSLIWSNVMMFDLGLSVFLPDPVFVPPSDVNFTPLPVPFCRVSSSPLPLSSCSFLITVCPHRSLSAISNPCRHRCFSSSSSFLFLVSHLFT